MVLEASYSTTYFSVPNLDPVETAPILMDSTLDGQDCTFLVICQGWTLVDALSYFVHHFCSLARK